MPIAGNMGRRTVTSPFATVYTDPITENWVTDIQTNLLSSHRAFYFFLLAVGVRLSLQQQFI